MKNIIILIVISICMYGCKTKIYTWNPKGPVSTNQQSISGPVKQIIIDRNNTSKLYAATENGGVWVIEDYKNENSRWNPITDTLENLQTRGFDVFKHNSQMLAMGNGLGFIHISYDGGSSWKKIEHHNFEYIRKLYFDYHIGTVPHLKVASSNGLFTINLQSFRSSGQVNIDTTRLDISSPSDEILDYFIDEYSDNGEIRYAAVRGQGVYRSGDFGSNWKLIQSLNSNNLIKFGLSSQDGRVVFKQDSSIYYASNTSSQFDIVNLPIRTINGTLDDDAIGNSDVGYRNFFGGTRGDWCHAIAIDPNNSDRLIAGITGYYITQNLENSWISRNYNSRNPFNHNCGHEDPHHLIFNGSDVLVANDGGVYVANFDENGLSCRSLNRGFNTLQFYRVGVKGLGATGNADHNGIWFTNSILAEKPNWNKINGRPFGNNSLEDDFVFRDRHQEYRFYFLFRNQHLNVLDFAFNGNSHSVNMHSNPNSPVRPFSRYRTNNSRFNRLNYPVKTIAQHPDDRLELLLLSTHAAAGNNGTQSNYSIKRTTDVDATGAIPNDCGDTRGSTWCDSIPTNYSNWDVIYDSGNIPIVGIEFSENGDAYALDEDGNFILSQDILAPNPTWTAVSSMPLLANEDARQFVFNHSNNDIYAMSHQKLYWFKAGDNSWEEIDFPLLNSNKLNSIVVHKNILYVATDRGVFTANPHGTKRFGVDLPNAPIMQLFVENEILYAVSFGRGLWSVLLK